MSAIILQDEIVHYEVLGRGRPLLFLHGWVGSWRYWIPTMQAASISFRTYALDLWGFGDTAKNSNLYPLDLQVQMLDAFMEKMGIGKIALVGHGLGAVVSMMYAARYPKFVDRVMAIGMPTDSASIHPRLRTDGPSELADWLLGRTPVTEAARVEAPKADPRAIVTTIEDTSRLQLSNLSASIVPPCLFVYGQDDTAIQMTNADQLSNLPEQTHYIVFEQSGHFPMLDEGNKFNRLMNDFLSLKSGESPRQLQLKEEWKRRVR